jgi:hypothetical protein
VAKSNIPDCVTAIEIVPNLLYKKTMGHENHFHQ